MKDNLLRALIVLLIIRTIYLLVTDGCVDQQGGQVYHLLIVKLPKLQAFQSQCFDFPVTF